MFQELPTSHHKLLRLHQLSRKERRQLREGAIRNLQENPFFLDLDSRSQKQIASSANTAAAWQVLLAARSDCSELRRAQGRLLAKAQLPLSQKRPSPLLRFPFKNAPLAPELLLFAAAVREGELYRSESALDHLRAISPLQPASAFLVPGENWDELFGPEKLLGLWDPRSELIFLRAEAEQRDHLLLHEMIHSLQKAGRRYGATYNRERNILLEGVTEEAAVLLDQQECSFYQKERAIARSLLEAARRPIKDLVFLSADQIFSFLCQELRQRERELAAWIRQRNSEELLANLRGNDYQEHQEKSLGARRGPLHLPPSA